MRLALRLAVRELRGGVRGLWIVLACLALGVAAIAAVGSLRESIARGLAEDGRRLLGGDLAVSGGAQPLPDSLRAWLRERGAQVSDIVSMRSMLIAPNGERQLVELKAVDGAYPLLGQAGLDPAGTLTEALALRDRRPGLVAERVVLDRLGVRPGALLRLGDATVEVRGALTMEPDRIATPAFLAPRAMVSAAALPQTQLVQPGSMLSYALRALLPPGANPRAVAQDLRAAFPGTGWRIRLADEAAPGVGRFIDQTALFMTLVGLTALLVGGIGVATGVRAWLEARARTIATLRCLGASQQLIFAVAGLQVLALAVLAVTVGLAVGAVLPSFITAAFGDALPVPPRAGVYWRPLLIAAAYGLLTAAAFALWPLARASQIPGAALFRDAVLPARVRAPGSVMAITALLVAALVGLTVATSPNRGFALWFCGAALGTLALFRVGGIILVWASRWASRAPALFRGRPWARLGVASLHRPGAATPLLLVSLGLGLSTLAAVSLIQGNLRQAILDQLPARAPTFYFIDIQPDQVARFEQLVTAQPGVSELRDVPSLRARVVSVGGVPAEQVQATPETRWALRGDRGLTYSAAPPEGTRLVQGAWWPADYRGPPLLSFDANLARGWNVKIGDTVRVNVLGRDIDLTVTNLRDVAWRSMSINFTMIASPGLLERAPHSHIATVKVSGGRDGAVLRAVTDALPNVSGIRVADVLAQVAALLDKVATALAATGGITLLSGALVLAGAVAAGQRRRIRDAVILKSVGATRAQIRAAFLVEFGLVGVAAGLVAALVGTVASWGVMRYVMKAPWSFLPGQLALTVLGCIVLMLLAGYAGTASALRAKAAPMLRNE